MKAWTSSTAFKSNRRQTIRLLPRPGSGSSGAVPVPSAGRPVAGADLRRGSGTVRSRLVPVIGSGLNRPRNGPRSAGVLGRGSERVGYRATTAPGNRPECGPRRGPGGSRSESRIIGNRRAAADQDAIDLPAQLVNELSGSGRRDPLAVAGGSGQFPIQRHRPLRNDPRLSLLQQFQVGRICRAASCCSKPLVTWTPAARSS